MIDEPPAPTGAPAASGQEGHVGQEIDEAGEPAWEAATTLSSPAGLGCRAG